jgi:hypothetical protein
MRAFFVVPSIMHTSERLTVPTLAILQNVGGVWDSSPMPNVGGFQSVIHCRPEKSKSKIVRFKLILQSEMQ